MAPIAYPTSIIKRDGSLASFDQNKITAAIEKAGGATGEFGPDEAMAITERVCRTINKTFDKTVPSVEMVQNMVEKALADAGYFETARAYIVYREKRNQTRSDRHAYVDATASINEYLSRADWRVNANANQGYSLGGLILNSAGKLIANYWLNHVYPEKVGAAHREGRYHIHDLDVLGGYCFTGDTRVKTLDGKNPTFTELVEQGVTEMWVYAYDAEKQEIVPAKAVAPCITRYVDELIEIELMTGEVFRCTPDHPIMLRDGSYCPASKLRKTSSLMPLNVTQNAKYSSIRNAWYNQQGKAYVHRWVAEQILGRPLAKNEVVHHINGDKHDNRPENLEVLPDAEHRSMELRKTMATEAWVKNNRRRLITYNKSPEKRAMVSSYAANRERDDLGRFAYVPAKDETKEYFNHKVRNYRTIHLDEPVPVYDLTVPGYSNFAIAEANIFVHNCAGWSLRTLLGEGFNGVPSKVESAPPKHLDVAMGQMVNFLGTLQNEWAGAQAFSSADTYLAPFVRIDHLPYEKVKQCMQSFVFNMNVPSRWGCVDTETEVLSTEGFKRYNELKEGDLIYVWDDGKLAVNPVRKVVVKPYKGKMHRYAARGYEQFVTPTHRVLARKEKDDRFAITTSERILSDSDATWFLPTAFENKTPIESTFLSQGNMSVETRDKADELQHLAIKEGWCTYVEKQDDKYVIRPIDNKEIEIESIDEVDYDGLVWCPNVEAGTAIFRKGNSTFISGQTQTPFTNLTFDLTCPDDLADQYPLIGGKPVDFTYGELQAEMDMINRAFCEVMIEGDAKGRIFTFPIPTYNITDDFDWNSDTATHIFDMTAKYGLPYFQNFLNSDLDPHMIRSMCPMPARTKVLVRESLRKAWHISDIENLDHSGKLYDVLCNGKTHKVRVNRFDGLEFMRLKFANGHEAAFSTNHTNRVLRKDETGAFSILEIPTEEVRKGDYLPFETHPVEGEGYDYETGFFVGAYLGNGSHISDNAIILSLNDTTKMPIAERVSRLARERFGIDAVLQNHEGKHLVSLRLNSRVMTAIVDEMIEGRAALEKAISPKVIAMSLEFRKGILDGLMATDGNAQRKRIYTSSETGVRNLCAMLASMGIPTNVTVDGRKTTDGKLSDNPVWCVGTYETNGGQNTYGSTFVKTDETMWFAVTETEHLGAKSAAGYCFEVVDGTEPLFMLPTGLVTHNCRLRLDLTELLRRGNGLFGSAEQTGSVGVVTMNMARLGYLHKADSTTIEATVESANETMETSGLYAELDELLQMAKVSLELKRKEVQHHIDSGLYPYTRRYLGTLRNHFSTIGVNGINEMIRNMSSDAFDICDPRGHALALAVLEHIRARMVEFQEETGHMYNLEATPAEGTTYRFAREDLKRYPDIIQAGTPAEPYYTNSSQLPVGYTTDPFQALEEQEELQKKYTGGTVLHLYMGERMSSTEACKQLVKRSLENFRLPYITVTPTFSICPKHGYIAGEHAYCPICDEELAAAKRNRKTGK